MERGARPRRELHLHQWRDLQPAAHREQRLHRQQREVPAASRASASPGARASAKTVVRAGFGMYNELQDALGYRMDQNAPFNPTYSIANAAGVAAADQSHCARCRRRPCWCPEACSPNLKMPTLISYSLGVEQEITPNTSLTLGYVGSHGYHEIVGVDANEPVPIICPASPCPAVYPSNFPGAAGGHAGSRRQLTTFPPARRRRIPTLANTWTWFSVGDSSTTRCRSTSIIASATGLSLRGVYTWSKALDDGDSLNATTAGNAPGLVSNPYDITRRLGTWRPTMCATSASISAVYDLPIRPRQAVRERAGRIRATHWSAAGRSTASSRCRADSRSRRSSATTRRTTATPAIRCGRS